MEVGGNKKIIKRNLGKQKIEMKKIENRKSCLITFSKRKDGIMNKANEVRALCNASVNLIMYSPTGKPYFYGDSSLKTMKMALSNEEQQPDDEEGDDDDFLSYILEGKSKVEMQDLIAKSDSLVDQLNAEKERGQNLDRVLKTVKNITNNNRWDSVGDSYEEKEEMEKELLVLQKLLKDQISLNSAINATAAASTHHHHGVDQTMVQVNNTGVIGSYPAVHHANPFATMRGIINDHNAPVWYPKSNQQQGYNGPFFYNVSNGNGVGGVSGHGDGDGSGGSGSHVYNNSNYNDGSIFGFPNENINLFNNGYGGGGFF